MPLCVLRDLGGKTKRVPFVEIREKPCFDFWFSLHTRNTNCH